MTNLKKWIKDQLNAGYSQDQILQSLLKAGYPEARARSALQKVLNQRKPNLKTMFKQYKPLIYLLVLLVIILFFTGGYLYASTSEEKIAKTPSVSTQPNIPPKINVTREVQREASPGSRLGVLLKTSFNQPLDVKLYEKLPQGFKIMNDISSMSSQKLDDNIYLFNIHKSENVYGIAITYFVKVPSDAKGEYQIEGWYEVNNQKINIEPSKFKIS